MSAESLEIRVARWPFVQVPSALVVDDAVNSGALRTYCAMALWGGVDGRAYPSKVKLAQARGLSQSTLFDHLGQLEAAGWVTRWCEAHQGKERWVIQLHHRRGGVQESGGGVTGKPDTPTPENRRQKETPERQPGKSDVAPTEPTPAPPAPTTLKDKAKALSAVYPHGSTEGGNRRPPGLKLARAAIGRSERDGTPFTTILEGARRFAEAVVGTKDEAYSPAMHRWVANEGWEDVPEPVGGRGPTPEEHLEAVQRNAALDEESKARAVEAAQARANAQRATSSDVSRLANRFGRGSTRPNGRRPQ